jgi:hypothetical protein
MKRKPIEISSSTFLLATVALLLAALLVQRERRKP